MKKIKILIPVYNDWESVFKLLENINLEASKIDINFSVIIINDASTDSKLKLSTSLENLESIQIIHMKENKGHGIFYLPLRFLFHSTPKETFQNLNEKLYRFYQKTVY